MLSKRCKRVQFLTFAVWLSVIVVPLVSAQAKLPEPLLDYSVKETFVGLTSFIDVTEDLDKVAGLSEATIAVRFKTSTMGVMSLFSASNDQFPDGEVCFPMAWGNLMCHVRGPGNAAGGKAHPTKVVYTAYQNICDGKWHVAILVLGKDGTAVYVDGTKLASGDVGVCFASVEGLNTMSIGRNVHDEGGEWYYEGDIDYVQIYDQVLTEEQIVELSK
ncbi:MAG: sialidase domain-containing protein [Limnochordia bacterium]|jgi:hypothetical protein|nr:hypothetical protein [Limnochordia bacterium]MDD2630129.1 sialidase domain-containing protein [Limnochordia bacterium]MDD4518093.1 sialidase domain-containing protein [Limnochordia bacterium]